MKPNPLSIASLLSIVLLPFHIGVSMHPTRMYIPVP